MSESVRLLKGIMKTSGWTQEQVATKLGVSFPTMNAWVNGKTRPRESMMVRIRKLYLAQDITKDVEATYVTLVNVPKWLKVGDPVVLEKEFDNSFDDEAIMVRVLDTDNEFGNDDEDEDVIADEEIEAIKVYSNYDDVMDYDNMYIANSTNTVVRGTNSAGRIYDRFEKKARGQVCFVFHKMAIARIVEWNYEE